MEVKQIYELTNEIVKEVTGEEGLVQEDLSNLVEVGTTIENAKGYDNYVRALVDRIGKMVFVNRVYRGRAPKVLMDGWEFGSILEKVQVDLPDAQENESWELVDGASYDPNIFTAPKVSVKFFNGKVTFEVPLSITEKQLKSAFVNAIQMNAFVSMIYNSIDKAMTIRLDNLIGRTINSMIARTLKAEVPSGQYSNRSGAKAVNLLYLYNQTYGTQLTKDVALNTPEFIRFATMQMNLYKGYLNTMSTLFNIEGKERFTSDDVLHLVLLQNFASASEVYLQSDTYHKELVKINGYETVPYWQGSGSSFALEDVSKINVKIDDTDAVVLDGILGVMFDRDALGVCNMDKRTTTNYNAKAEFWNEWYKMDAQYFNDAQENFVLFYMA